MKSRQTRLDRFLKQTQGIDKHDCRQMLAAGRIRLDGVTAESVQQIVHQFTQVKIDGAVIQQKDAIYIAMNKPTGVLSATKDAQQETALDLIDHPKASELHIAGRLDKYSSGLLLLSNDGRWSRALSTPENHVEKAYQVTVQNPLTDEMRQAFEDGIYFETEGVTTQPARLLITGERSATVILTDGKYHQIKRMFGRFRNPVLSIHRIQIGGLTLADLNDAQWKTLSSDELDAIAVPYRANSEN